MSEIQQILAYLGLSAPAKQNVPQNASPAVRKTIYLYWGEGKEEKYYPKIGYQGLPYESANVIDTVDVSRLWQQFTGSSKSKLDHVMHTWYGADTYETKSCRNLYKNERYCIHNAGNDAYWQLRILLDVLCRHLVACCDAEKLMGLAHDFYGDVIFKSIDFEEWALAGPGPGHWQEIGITILDTRTLKNQALGEACSMLKPYHFANKLFNAQIQNAGRRNAIGAWCRNKCRPEAFKHGRTCWIHRDLAASIVKRFFEIPCTADAVTYLDSAVATMVRSKRNQGVGSEEAERMFGKGRGWGIAGYSI